MLLVIGSNEPLWQLRTLEIITAMANALTEIQNNGTRFFGNNKKHNLYLPEDR